MTRPTRSEHGDERRTNHNAERIGTDDMSRAGYRNAEVSGNIREQPHHDELARADAEAPDSERQFRPSGAAALHCSRIGGGRVQVSPGQGFVVRFGDQWMGRMCGRYGSRISRVVPRVSIETGACDAVRDDQPCERNGCANAERTSAMT